MSYTLHPRQAAICTWTRKKDLCNSGIHTALWENRRKKRQAVTLHLLPGFCTAQGLGSLSHRANASWALLSRISEKPAGLSTQGSTKWWAVLMSPSSFQAALIVPPWAQASTAHSSAVFNFSLADPAGTHLLYLSKPCSKPL